MGISGPLEKGPGGVGTGKTAAEPNRPSPVITAPGAWPGAAWRVQVRRPTSLGLGRAADR